MSKSAPSPTPREEKARKPQIEDNNQEVVIINTNEQTTPTPTILVVQKPLEKYVLSVIKCPICYQYALKGQLPICSNGHLICGKC